MNLTDLQFRKGTYLAYVLSEADQADLIRRFPPAYSKVICHHVTVEFDLTEKKLKDIIDGLTLRSRGTFLDEAKVFVTGRTIMDGVDFLTVEINGRSRRPDGGFYHITLSVEPPHKPVESNKLLALDDGAPQEKVRVPHLVQGSFRLESK